MLVGEVMGLLEHDGTVVTRVGDSCVDIGHLQREVDDPVAVRGKVSADGGAGVCLAGEHEPGLA